MISLLQKQRIWSVTSLLQALAALLVLAFILPWFIPVKQIQTMLEIRLTASLGHPVQVDGASLHLLPNFELRAKSVQINMPNLTPIRIDGVIFPLDFLGGVIKNDSIRILADRAIISPEELFAVLSNSDLPGQFNLPHFSLKNIYLSAATKLSDNALGLEFIPLPSGDVQINLSQGTDLLIIKVKRAGKALLFSVDAPIWHLATPEGGALTINNASGQGRLADMHLEFDQLKAILNGGQIRGALRLARDNNWHATGSITFQQVPMEPLLAWMGIPLLSGNATGTMYLSSDVSDFAAITSAASISGQLAVNSGKIIGLDLLTPAKYLTIGDSTGGVTPFNYVNLTLDRQGVGEWSITLDELKSDTLTGQGLVQVNGGVSLDGVINVTPKTDVVREVPLLVAGTIQRILVRVALEALEKDGTTPKASTENLASDTSTSNADSSLDRDVNDKSDSTLNQDDVIEPHDVTEPLDISSPLRARVISHSVHIENEDQLH